MYIWVVAGHASVNIDLISAGLLPAAVMADMVDNDSALNEELKDSRLADTRAEIEKERAAAPQDRSARLVTDGEYKALMDRVEAAEALARRKKRGFWSDAMREERESDGYP